MGQIELFENYSYWKMPSKNSSVLGLKNSILQEQINSFIVGVNYNGSYFNK